MEAKEHELLKKALYALNVIPNQKNAGEDGEDSYSIASEIEQFISQDIKETKEKIQKNNQCKNPHIVCSNCNSNNIELRYWVSMQSGEITNDCDEWECYCNDCQEHHDYTLKVDEIEV